MKLYFVPGGTSLSPHICLREAGLAFTPVLTDTRTKKLADGSDYLAINPKGQVPLLELDDGQRLTEGTAILQYIADQVPERKLAPAWGTMGRYRLIEWLNFIATEMDKGFAPLFNPAMPEQAKALARTKLDEKLAWVNQQLQGNEYLMGERFTVADAYLFTVSSWAKYVGVDIAPLKSLSAHVARVAARPAVQATLKAEGLIK